MDLQARTLWDLLCKTQKYSKGIYKNVENVLL